MLPTTSTDSTNTRDIQERHFSEPSVSDGLRLANGHSVGSRALQASFQERLQEKDPREAEPSEEDGGRLGVGLGEPAHWREAKPSILVSRISPDMSNTRMRLLDTAPIPNSGGELGLYEHGEDFVIKIVGGQDLMSTRTHGSADALAEIACTEIACCERPRVLIGGLGMGFTLASALRHLGHDAEVVVAELVPDVVEWNRGPLGEHAGHPLRDERVHRSRG